MRDEPDNLAPVVLPRAALAFGIVGHRNSAAAAAVGETIERILSKTRQHLLDICKDDLENGGPYCPDGPLLSLISALADGADMIAARAARACGIPVDAVLPFSLAQTRADHADETGRQMFDEVVTGCRARLVLGLSPGSEDEKTSAYDLAGRILVSQSDILIAVWDGGLSKGRGGTREMIERAARLGIPIIHIDPAMPSKPRLLWTEIAQQRDIEIHIDDLRAASPPLWPDGEAAGGRLKELVWRLAEAPPALRNVTDNRNPADSTAASRFLADQSAHSSQRLQREAERLQDLLHPFADLSSHQGEAERTPLRRLLNAYAAADATATRYGDRFRLLVGSIFVCAALALITAALSIAAEVHLSAQLLSSAARLLGLPAPVDNEMGVHLVLASLELVLIGIMIAITYLGRRFQCHRRWIDAREVAERLRLSLVFWTLGIWPWRLETADHWIGWYVRAHLRQQALCDNHLRPMWTDHLQKILGRFLHDQIGYHNRNRKKMENRAHLLGYITLFCVAVTMALLAGLIIDLGCPACVGVLPAWMRKLFEFLKEHLPAISIIGTAVSFAAFGLKTTLDFEGIAERSHRTAEALRGWQTRLNGIGDNIAELHAFAVGLSDTLLADLAHWRATAESRVLDMPA